MSHSYYRNENTTAHGHPPHCSDYCQFQDIVMNNIYAKADTYIRYILAGIVPVDIDAAKNDFDAAVKLFNDQYPDSIVLPTTITLRMLQNNGGLLCRFIKFTCLVDKDMC